MWRKADENKGKSSPALAEHADPAPQENSQSVPVAVPQGIRIKGEISGQGNFCIDGEFDGNVCLGGTFTVGPNARINADIEAREVVIRGELIGSLKSCERVHIWSTGRLTGNMETRGIVIEDGAVLHSKVAVPKKAAQGAAVLNPEVPQSEIEQRAKGATA